MTKVLITGGHGFIGQYVVEELVKNDREVLIFDRHQRRVGGQEGVENFLGDIRDQTAVNEAMAHADSWIHLAGVLGTQETIQNPMPAVETNVVGGLNILEAASRYQLPGVNISVGNWFEDNPYSLSKHSIERFCSMYRRFREVRVSVVRAFNAYGPRQAASEPFGPSKVRKVIPSFILRALSGMPIEIYGDGEQVMDMIYVADVAKVLVSSLIQTEMIGPSSQVVEAGTGRRTTVNDIARKVVEAVGRGEIQHVPLRPGESKGAVVLANTSTLEFAKIDAETMTSLELGIHLTVPYYRTMLSDK